MQDILRKLLSEIANADDDAKSTLLRRIPKRSKTANLLGDIMIDTEENADIREAAFIAFRYLLTIDVQPDAAPVPDYLERLTQDEMLTDDVRQNAASLLHSLDSGNPRGDYKAVDIEWLTVPGGTRTVTRKIPGHMREGIPPRKVTEQVSNPDYKIARRPITNRQWQQFMQAEDGYRNKLWWAFSLKSVRVRRDYPLAPATDDPDAPRTNISFYAATAFCRWLSHKTGENILVPEEHERDHALSRVRKEMQLVNTINEWTASRMRGRSGYQVIKGKRRDSKVPGAKDSNLGFRPVQKNDRTVETFQPEYSLNHYMDQLKTEKNALAMNHLPPPAMMIAIHNEPESIPRLINLLADKRERTRGGAIVALYLLSGAQRLPAQSIIDYIARESNAVSRRRAADALVDNGKASVAAARKALDHENPHVRQNMVRVLALLHFRWNTPTADILDILRDKANDTASDVAFEAIAHLHHAEPTDDLIQFLREKLSNEKLRRIAIETLAAWGVDPEPVAADKKEPVRVDPDLTHTPEKTDTLINDIPRRTNLDEQLGLQWADVPSGKVTISRTVPTGRHDTETRDEVLESSGEGLRIQTRPVTIKQFNIFLDEAYDNRRWWEYTRKAILDRGYDYKEPSGHSPYIDNISFWTAQAFAFWVSHHTGILHRLPYESEWLLAVEHNLIEVHQAEWVVYPQGWYDVPSYPDKIKPTKRTVESRSEPIPLSREENKGFRLVMTDRPFESPYHPIDDVDTLLAMFDSASKKERESILISMARAADKRIVPTLLELASDENFAAVFNLYWISDRVPLPVRPVIDLLTIRSTHTIRPVQHTLIEMGDIAVEPLRQVILHGEPIMRRNALMPYRRLLGQDAEPLFIQILRDDTDRHLRHGITFELGRTRGEDAIAALRECTDDPDGWVAEAARRALSRS